MCNVLFTFAYWIATAMESDFGVCHYDAKRYQDFFMTGSKGYPWSYPEGLAVPGLAGAAFRSQALRAVAARVLPRASAKRRSLSMLDIARSNDRIGKHYLLDSVQFRHLLSASSILCVGGYAFRNKPALFRNREAIVDFLRPNEEQKAAVDSFEEKAREGCSHLVGIHMRRGDYATYSQGKYHYDDAVYRELIASLDSMLGGGARYVLVSNEPIRLESFEPYDVRVGPGTAVADLYTLARCDLIMGPPSTFSLWASLQRMTPLYQIYDPSASFAMDDFRPVSPDTAP